MIFATTGGEQWMPISSHFSRASAH